jgi:hypothetical protein
MVVGRVVVGWLREETLEEKVWKCGCEKVVIVIAGV